MPLTPFITRHAEQRTRTRRIPPDAIPMALLYGHCRRDRGAEIYTIGWRDVRWWAEQGLDISRFEGIEVVCGNGGRVITVYRNRKPGAARDRSSRAAA